jgi:hypothetical protein
MEGFVMSVLRQAAIEIEAYSREPARGDNIDAFLAWLVSRTAVPSTSSD